MQNPTSPPWYKQFWPWFLIAIPCISVILSTTMFRLASNTDDSLVIDDYYKEGRAINLQLAKVQEARVRGIQTMLQISETSIVLRFEAGEPASASALKVNFHHATLATKDFSLMLVKDAQGNYRGPVDAPLSGKWRISLQPVDGVWRFSQTITLPRRDPIPFNP